MNRAIRRQEMGVNGIHQEAIRKPDNDHRNPNISTKRNNQQNNQELKSRRFHSMKGKPIRSGRGRTSKETGSDGEEEEIKTCRALTKVLLLSMETSSKVMAPLSDGHCCILPLLSHTTPAIGRKGAERKGGAGAVRLLTPSCALLPLTD